MHSVNTDIGLVFHTGAWQPFAMSMARRIREARLAKKMSQSDLAKIINKTQPTVQRWEDEDNQTLPDRDMVKRLAVALGVNTIWLESGHGGATAPGMSEPTYAPDNQASISRDREFPVFAATETTDGLMQIHRHREAVDFAVPPFRLRNAFDAFGVYVIGEAMSPRYEPGEIVWIHPTRPVKPGDDALFIRDRQGLSEEEALIRRVIKITPRFYQIRSFNPKVDEGLDRSSWKALLIAGRD